MSSNCRPRTMVRIESAQNSLERAHFAGMSPVAFPSEEMRPTLTLTLGTRQRAPATRAATSRSGAAKKRDVVEIPASTIESERTLPPASA